MSDAGSTEVRDGIHYGIRTGGYRGIEKIGGNFRNGEFGNYKLAVRDSVKKVIIVRYGDGKVLVFNLDTSEQTLKFYSELKRTVGL